MKRKVLVASISLFSLLSLLCFHQFFFTVNQNITENQLDRYSENSYPRPTLEKDDSDDKRTRKTRNWTEEEVHYYKSAYDEVRNSLKEYEEFKNRPTVLPVSTDLAGEWKSSGPFNMPGAFQFCEMDEGTDTVYAVTCGHYGGTQFIWKGTLTDDKWEMINPKHPSRYSDVIVIPNGSKRRVLAGHFNGHIMYSDNGGKTWEESAGLTDGVKSLIVNRQDNNKLYATNGKAVYVSTDRGSNFSKLQDITSSSYNSKLYSPRWNSQPGANNVYLAIDDKFYKLNASKTEFNNIGTLASSGWIGIGGDTRGLWVTRNGNKWYKSTDGGETWVYKYTEGNWYSDVSEGMSVGHYPGISPENPNTIIGGYAIPLTSRDAGATTNHDAQFYWGRYQNSVGNDPKVRGNFHPDFQASQFFYDKNGDLITLRSSDGGVFVSYNEWQKTGYNSLTDIEGVYYNITLFGVPTQETYRGAFAYGYKDINDLTVGTQDQGWQTTRLSSYGDDILSWDQVIGGDGPNILTSDGKIGWEYDPFGKGGKRRELYNSTGKFVGITGPDSDRFEDPNWSQGYYWIPAVVDWNNPERIWMLSRSLRRMEYNTSTNEITGHEDPFYYAQGLTQSRVNPNVVYCLHDGNVHKSTNSGDSWSQIANQNATGVTSRYENKGMGWCSPNNEDMILFATESGTDVKSILSLDGGLTWKDVTGSGANLFPPAQVNGMAGNEAGTLIFASTNMGPYVFVVSKQKWFPMATDPDVPLFWGQNVYCIKYGEKEVVRFATWGQGIWDFTIDYDYVPPHTTASLGNDQVLCGRESILLSANVPTDGKKTFTWYKDGIIIEPASLTKNTLEVTELGEYICELDSLGEWTTQDAVNITDLPSINLGADKHLCETSSVLLSTGLSDPYIENTWYKDGVEIFGEDTHEFLATKAGTYRCFISAQGCSNQEDEIEITSDLIDVSDDEQCEAGTVSLQVNATSGTYKWYNLPEGGNELHEGSTYSPSITETTHYYVEDASAVTETFGPNSVDDYSNKQTTWEGVKLDKVKFEVHTNIVLNSVDIFSSNATSVTCKIFGSDKTSVIKTSTITPVAGKNTIPLNVSLSPGTYYMNAEGTVGQLFFNGDQSSIPSYSTFNLAGKISFTGTEPAWVENNKRWMFFYNWKATEGNSCARTLVQGVIDPLGGGCNVVGIDDHLFNTKLQNVKVSTYPNPANSDLYCEVNNLSHESLTIELMGLSGQRFQTLQVEGKSNETHTIDVSNLAKGTYLLKVTSDKQSQIEKVIIR